MSNLRRQYGFLEKFRVWFSSSSVIVFTMGKVGTLTICNSLDAVGIRHVHPHSLRYTRPGVHFLKNVKLSFFRNLFFGYKTLMKRVKVFVWLLFVREVKVITGVRDPFSRAISAFFEQSHYLGFNPATIEYARALEKFKHHYDLSGGVEWFDREIFDVFDVDVFSGVFNRDMGYQIIERGKYKIFIYRIDFLNSLEGPLGVFLGEGSFKILPANETPHSKNYERMKKEYKFLPSEFKYVENSKYIRHFYDDSEILNLKKCWVEN